MFASSLIAGACAAAGSTLGKLSGTFAVGAAAASSDTGAAITTRTVSVLWAVSGALLGAMVCVNTAGYRYYVRALDSSSSSAIPAVVSAAFAYILSGVCGALLFDEWSAKPSVWWCGAALVCLGLALLPSSPSSRSTLLDDTAASSTPPPPNSRQHLHAD